MAQLTIAQRRERQLERFTEYYIKDESKARYIANSYYRLCGLSLRNFYNDNDERTCNKAWHKEEEEKEERWVKRLNALLKDYDLKITYSGIYPAISRTDGSRIIEQVFECISY